MSGFCFYFEKGDPGVENWFTTAQAWGIRRLACIKAVHRPIQIEVPPEIELNVYRNADEWIESTKIPIYIVGANDLESGIDLNKFKHPVECWYWFGPQGGHRRTHPIVNEIIRVGQHGKYSLPSCFTAPIIAQSRYEYETKKLLSMVDG